jgi:hypothetical protein
VKAEAAYQVARAQHQMVSWREMSQSVPIVLKTFSISNNMKMLSSTMVKHYS